MAIAYRCDRLSCSVVSDAPLNKVELIDISLAAPVSHRVVEVCSACFDQVCSLLMVQHG